jgi:hypothetical protein
VLDFHETNVNVIFDVIIAARYDLLYGQSCKVRNQVRYLSLIVAWRLLEELAERGNS